MKALLITPDTRTIEAIDVAGRDDIVRLIGHETIESDAVGKNGDRLFFDEECFLRGGGVRFQIDTVIPISGRAVLVGTTNDGAVLVDVVTDADSLRGRIRYL